MYIVPIVVIYGAQTIRRPTDRVPNTLLCTQIEWNGTLFAGVCMRIGSGPSTVAFRVFLQHNDQQATFHRLCHLSQHSIGFYHRCERNQCLSSSDFHRSTFCDRYSALVAFLNLIFKKSSKMNATNREKNECVKNSQNFKFYYIIPIQKNMCLRPTTHAFMFGWRKIRIEFIKNRKF